MQDMPVVFVGHGSPMNAIEDNGFTRSWELLGEELPIPPAILCVSAHWFTRGTKTADDPRPNTVHDFYGFPEALYRVEYPAPGSPEWAHTTVDLLDGRAQIDNSWGIDHGAWSVLRRMFPQADVPVYQLSVDASASMEERYERGRALAPLRKQGVLIMGSGNMVHNLGMVDWSSEGGFPWADEFDRYIREAVLAGDHGKVIDYRQAGSAARLAVPTPDHFAPLVYALGAAGTGGTVETFNEARTMGSLSMTGYVFA